MNDRPLPLSRADFPRFHRIETRWSDNDGYGHINNIYYYGYFDTAVTAFLIEARLLDFRHGATIGLVVESHCNYFAPLAFPGPVEVGLRIGRLGSSSVRYELGVFAPGAETAAAQGHFIHVYVDRATSRPVALDEAFRSALRPLISETTSDAGAKPQPA